MIHHQATQSNTLNAQIPSKLPKIVDPRPFDMLINTNELVDNIMPDQFFADCFLKDYNVFARPAEDSLIVDFISRDFGLFENLIAKLNDSLLQGKCLTAWLVYDK